MKKALMVGAIFIVAGTLIMVLFSKSNTEVNSANTNQAKLVNNQTFQNIATPSEATLVSWQTAELTDVRTGNKFKIADFKGKPVLLESFAVWCPTCLKQQKEMVKLKEVDGMEVVHIALDTDPNEEADKVLEHVNEHNFDWYYAISPIEFTRSLTDEFGLGIVNAPSAPVVLICEDQNFRMLKRGVKTAEKLTEEIKIGC